VTATSNTMNEPDDRNERNERTDDPSKRPDARGDAAGKHRATKDHERNVSRSADQSAAADLSRGQGSDGYGGGGAGIEHSRGAHPRGQRPSTHDDRHPGSGWEDPSASPRPSGGERGSEGDASRRASGTGETTNRPGGNWQIRPRTSDKSKTYDRDTPTDASRDERDTDGDSR
jgi:hypothetical protein